MLFKALAIVGFAATSVIADGAAIVSVLNTIRTDNAAFNSTIVNWDGTLFGALPILGASTTLDNAVKNGTVVANASAPLTLDEAVAVYTATNALSGDIGITIDNLIAAKPKFDNNSITFVVQSSLQSTRKDSADFGAAVVRKVPDNLQSFAQGVVAQIDAQFARAQAVYGKPLFG